MKKNVNENNQLKIISIKTKITSVPFQDPPKTGFLTLEKIDLLIVQIETKGKYKLNNKEFWIKI